MALTANRDLLFYTSRELIEVPVDDNANIFKGALVGRKRATGYARPLVAGDEFLGVAYKQADNTVAGHTAGGISVRLYQAIDIVHTLTGVAVADIGKDVYASDDATLTLTPTGNSRIGRVISVESTNLARVRIQPVTEFEGQFENLPIISLADAAATLTLDHMNRVLLMANSTGRTLTLPAAATVRAGAWIRVVKTNVTAAAITLDGNAAETIDGAATLATLDAQFDTVLLLCTGSEWIVLSRDIA
ncbi:MAG: hypothetical protein IT450_07320 [Phycisphaerales bacterium]|nr:hypothetical protein [Phycisphaerales bacterium]